MRRTAISGAAAVTAALAIVLSGCGWAPLYADRETEPADAELIEAIVAELGPSASDWRAVVALLRARPELVTINAHVEIKPTAAG